MSPISSTAEYRDRDRRFARQRQDWLYVPLEPSPPPLGHWSWLRHCSRWDIAAAVGAVALMLLAFPAADLEDQQARRL
jgi:hypothetical protein